MPRAIAYHRPDSVEDVVALLNDNSYQPLAGGTVLNGDDDPTPVTMVDLQGCGLDGIGGDAGQLRLGAMTTLHDMLNDERVPTVSLSRHGCPGFRGICWRVVAL